jgi:predicted CXXCH cytochrome family protein
MKTYEFTYCKIEHESIRVDADSPHEAEKKARTLRARPWRMSDDFQEIQQSGEVGDSFNLYGICENCDTPILEGEKYVITEDDITLCADCHKALLPTQTKE